jgi:hypothetical protein
MSLRRVEPARFPALNDTNFDRVERRTPAATSKGRVFRARQGRLRFTAIPVQRKMLKEETSGNA